MGQCVELRPVEMAEPGEGGLGVAERPGLAEVLVGAEVGAGGRWATGGRWAPARRRGPSRRPRAVPAAEVPGRREVGRMLA